TATKWTAACTSIPAACRWVTVRSARSSHRRKCFPRRGVMALSTLEGALGEKKPRARERVSKSSLPNGDIRRLRGGATNEVVASSRGHAHLRVVNTRERPATATRSTDSIHYQGRVREGSP